MLARRILLLVCCAQLSLAAADSPHRVAVTVRSNITNRYDTDAIPVDRILTIAAQAAGPVSPESTAVLQADLDSIRSHLTVPLLEPVRVATMVRNGADILIAGWPPASSRETIHPILLIDDAESQTIVIECSASRLESPIKVQQLIESISKFDTVYFAGAQMYFKYPRDRGAIVSGFSLDGWLAQFDLPGQVVFSAFLKGTHAYLRVRFSPLMGQFPSELKHIKERFPPLRTRVCDWPTPQLLASIGEPTYQRFGTVSQRDEILIDELVTRKDFTSGDFKRLLERRDGPAYYMLASTVKNHRVLEFSGIIREHIGRAGQSTYDRDRMLGAIASEPSLDFEESAIECLEREPRAASRGCVAQLASHGKTERALKAVAAAQPWPRVPQATLDEALSQIAARLK